MAQTVYTLEKPVPVAQALRDCFPAYTALREAWTSMGEDWPMSQELLSSFIKYYSTSIHSNGQPIIYRVLTETVRRYHEAQDLPAQQRRNALHYGFFTALRGLPNIVLQDVLTSWYPGDEMTLPRWMRHRDPFVIQVCHHGRLGQEKAEAVTRRLVHARLADSIISVGQKVTRLSA